MLFKINIIDDEKNLNDLVRTYLEKEGYSVCSFYTYDEALLHKDDDVHLWLIDIMLDKASGFELFNEIKASKPKMPIIFMSARDQEFDRIIGLEKGSDDYITKPFNIKEVILRINNLLKRAYDNPSKIQIDGYDIDLEKRRVFYNNNEIRVPVIAATSIGTAVINNQLHIGYSIFVCVHPIYAEIFRTTEDTVFIQVYQ